ncbi:MAG: cation diffusion facilitator family transporter [bacterium]|nr:cation diffusion facilitator family transporter [bacterium]
MSHNHLHKIRKDNLKIAILLNLGFSIFEFIFGLIFNSKMILADAIHDAGDAGVLASMFLVDFFSKKKPTRKYNYGFRRLSVVGAVVTSGLILLGSYQVARYVYYEFARPHYHPYVNVPGLMAVSAIGVVVNLWSAKKLHGSKSLLDKAIFTHMLEDLMGWIMAFLSSILIWFTGFHQIDRVMSLVILLMVGWNAIEVMVKSVKVLLNSAPSVKDFTKIDEEILRIEGILQIENSHFWTLDGEQNIYTATIFIEKGVKKSKSRTEISKILAGFGVVDSTIEFFEK